MVMLGRVWSWDQTKTSIAWTMAQSVLLNCLCLVWSVHNSDHLLAGHRKNNSNLATHAQFDILAIANSHTELTMKAFHLSPSFLEHLPVKLSNNSCLQVVECGLCLMALAC